MKVRIPEKDWQDQVIQLAEVLQYRIAHFRPAPSKRGWKTPMIGDPGWPDLVLLRPPRLVLAELKVDPETAISGRPSAEQQVWLDMLGLVPGVEVFIWRPPDLDRIVEILRHRERPA